MQSASSARNIAVWGALGALFLLPFTPLVVANSDFFPFITGKAFYLRILIELAVASWVILAFLDKAYRPRLSLIGIVVTGFVAWLFVADVFALNTAKAFWSNFERMEGWVLLIHLLGFFFAASAVLRVTKKWRAWFLTSLFVSLIVCGHAFLQLSGALSIHQGSTRVDASFGNSAYLAVYLLFNVFIALWLALTERRAWLKYALILLALVEAGLIFFTETRGAILGLIGALGLCALLTALTAGKHARRLAILGLAFLILVSGSFYLARASNFVQENHVLQRVASISLADGETRFTIWKIAFKGVKDNPVLGWGQEGFNYVFNTYYDPSLYEQEQWFDRAHNAFIDWLSAGGVPAFLLYLSLFLSAIFLLWRSTELSRPERIALTGVLAGYACHNFFVFDNLYSYIYFFAILALIDSQVARPIEKFENAPEISQHAGTTYVLPITFVVALMVMWFVNVPGMRVATNLIQALSNTPGGVEENIALLEELVARPSFAAQEIREQLVSFAARALQNSQVNEEQRQRIASLAVEEMRKQVTSYPRDARAHMQLSYIYRVAGASELALKEVETAISLSPEKEGFWIEAGSINWDSGRFKEARANFSKAYELGPQFPELALYAAAGAIATGDLASADALLLDTYGTIEVPEDILAAAYYRTKNWSRLLPLLKTRADAPDARVENWLSLAAIYYASGNSVLAMGTLQEALQRFPSSKAIIDSARLQIQSGTITQ